ncbi:hypothetical protein GCM10027294_53340 [Marinactinospora endophytica]
MYTIGAAFCLGLFWLIRKKVHWIISAALAVLGGALFALSFLGDWAIAVITWVLGFALGLLPEPVSVSAVLAAVSLFVVVMVATDAWKDKKLDEHGQWAAICLPILVLAASGSVGATGTAVVDAVAGAGTGVFGPLLGW